MGTVETENENGKFERKQRQVQRLIDTEQAKISSLESQQHQLLDESEQIESIKTQEKSKLSELSKYNAEMAIDKLVENIHKLEEESNDLLIDNLIKAQDEVEFMAEEASKLLNSQIQLRL